MYIRIALLLLTAIFFSSVNADILRITNLTVGETQPNGSYPVTVSWTTVPDANDKAKYPCTYDTCKYGIFVEATTPTGGLSGGSFVKYWSITSIDTWRYATGGRTPTWEYINTIYGQTKPKSGTGTVTVDRSYRKPKICVGAVRVSPYSGGSDTIYPYDGGSCGRVIPPTETLSCQVINNVIDINHGTLPAKQANNNVANQTIQLTCNNTATLSVLIAQPELDLGGGVKSSLSIVGHPNPSTVNVSNTLNLTMESKLSVSGDVSLGNHTGNTVLILNYQ